MESLRPASSAQGRASAGVTLSICCMTSGRRPRLLSGVLAPLRGVADEIVVAVESERAAGVHEALRGIADRVLAFPATAPADRPIAWLFRGCAGRWILNVDDDEVPSPRLVAALPALVRRDDITHAWIARRWLHPGHDSFIASPPWGNEFQLRFVLADERFLQFSDAFHRPVICHGPSIYVDAPLWHLDTTLNPAAGRRRKAAAYERERAGMRVAGLAHNTGFYVPELYRGLELEDVPDEDRLAIESALAAPASGELERSPELVEVSEEEVDAAWVGPPYDPTLHSGELALLAQPRALYAAAQTAIDVVVTNRSRRVWPWGAEARPAIRLAYSWRRDGVVVEDGLALRTSLPADLAPGASEVVPVHVVPPPVAGRYELALDLSHEGVGLFGTGVRAELEVRPSRRVAVIASPARMRDLAVELELPPDVELVALLRDAVDREEYVDFATVVALRPYLLAGAERRGRLRTLGTVVRRAAVAVRASTTHWSRPEYRQLVELRDTSDALIVDSPSWASDAAFGREWAWVVATALMWRLRRKPVFVNENAVPGGSGVRERSLRVALRSLRR